MKILEINVFNYKKGGSETVYFNTTNILQENGNKVINFTLKWFDNYPSLQEEYFPESKETRKGLLRPIKNFINYFYHFEAAKKLKQLIEDEKPDLAQIHLIWGQITPSILPILKKHNIPIIFTIHEYRIVCPAYTFRNGKGKICEECKGKKFYKCILYKCCKNSYILSIMMATEQYFRNLFFSPAKYIDGLIYVSKFAKEKHEEYMPLLKDKANIVLYNLNHTIKSTITDSPNERYYLFFGRLSHEKGIHTLIKAFEKIPTYKLKIVGVGPLEDELKEYIKNKNIKNIKFLGYKTGKELSTLIENAYFITVPSEWYENNPMTIIEGYSAGVPVIGTKIGGIPEIIQENKTGYLFSAGNIDELILTIIKSNQLTHNEYTKFQDNALKFARKHFNRDNYYPQLMNFYSQVLSITK